MATEFELSDDMIDRIAQLIHAQYLIDHAEDQADTHPAMQPWDGLSDELQEQNRGQARDNIEKLRDSGYQLAPASEEEESVAVDLDDDTIETLARQEHERWAASKMADGYVYGPERNDDPSDLRHPDLLDWDDPRFTEWHKDKDRRPVRRMAEIFAAEGLAVVAIDAPQ